MLLLNNDWHSFSGTSIGFKNIASKIANELKLWLPGSVPRRRRRRRPSPPSPPSPTSPPPPPPRTDSLKLSTEDMVLVANAGLRTPSGTLAHYLTAYTPDSFTRSDYLRPQLSTYTPDSFTRSDYYLRPPSPVQPRSSLSLRADSMDVPRIMHTSSVHLIRQARVRSPPSPECDCLPIDPIPPPELFDFWIFVFF